MSWWRVITSTFVHLGFLHVLFNMMVLAQIGPFMERILGNAAFLIVYLVSGITGALCSLAWDPYMYSAGASGAIFGLYGALVGFLALRRDSVASEQLVSLLKGAGVFLVYNTIFGFVHSGTDIAAHVGGLVGGLISGLVISNPIDAGFKRRRIVRASMLGLAGAPAILAIGLALPRPMDFVKELTNFGAVEKHVLANYRGIMAQVGTESNKATALKIQNDVLRPWKSERQILAKYKGLPSRQQKFLTAIVEYMDSLQQAWTKLAQSFEKDGSAEQTSKNDGEFAISVPERASVRLYNRFVDESNDIGQVPDTRLAVYGTLAPGRVNHHQISALAGTWQRGTVKGHLFPSGWGAALGFPGLILDPEGPVVTVDLFESADLPQHWKRLDDFEGEGYRRVVAIVTTERGERNAWIYVLAQERP